LRAINYFNWGSTAKKKIPDKGGGEKEVKEIAVSIKKEGLLQRKTKGTLQREWGKEGPERVK